MVMADFLDFNALERPASPNTFLAAPKGSYEDARPDLDTPAFDIPVSELCRKLRGVISAEKSWKRLQASEDGMQMRFVAVTSFLRFKDDVFVSVLPVEGDAGASTLAIYSASRVGYSDFGVNEKRVRDLLARL